MHTRKGHSPVSNTLPHELQLCSILLAFLTIPKIMQTGYKGYSISLHQSGRAHVDSNPSTQLAHWKTGVTRHACLTLWLFTPGIVVCWEKEWEECKFSSYIISHEDNLPTNSGSRLAPPFLTGTCTIREQYIIYIVVCTKKSLVKQALLFVNTSVAYYNTRLLSTLDVFFYVCVWWNTWAQEFYCA